MRPMQMLVGLTLLALTVTACAPAGFTIDQGRFASNGERIYFTGAGATGRIGYSGGEFGGGMMGSGRLACVDCHGPDARGGQHVMHMTVMDAPDIRWATLSQAEHGDHGDEGEMDHPPYDEAAFKQAVTQGLNPGGRPLGPAMPRWRMSEQDLDELIAFLKTVD
ncbi:MAG: c-type cytochrome [Anaerolineae bacterium]